MQCQIDQILQSYCSYTQVYINDIVIYLKILEEHLMHLNNIFELLTSFDIVFISIKTFLGFSFTTLLNQKVNLFDITAAAEKIQTIS